MACFCMLSIASLMVMPASAGTERNWTGANSANWSDPNNWSPIGVPQNGDELVFGYVDDSNKSMVNDLTGLISSTWVSPIMIIKSMGIL